MVEIIIFAVIVITMLLLDLGVFNKKSHEVTNKEAVTWSMVWIGLALGFAGFIYYMDGSERASQSVFSVGALRSY